MKDITETNIEQYRLLDAGRFSSNTIDGNNGAFLIPYKGKRLLCLVSDQMGWDHVSVTLRDKKRDVQIKRCPTWEEMSFVKSCFFGAGEVVVQLHVADKDHVNINDYCLHLWKKQGAAVDVPPSIFV